MRRERGDHRVTSFDSFRGGLALRIEILITWPLNWRILCTHPPHMARLYTLPAQPGKLSTESWCNLRSWHLGCKSMFKSYCRTAPHSGDDVLLVTLTIS